ncbi:MAG: hypothetical protein J5631_10575 [Spirochaetaceae bacterium]|nr:hypothetical protein [Spirochaetaceae bacterium]
MNKPDISPDFTIDDIHKIREYNYEQTKNLSVEEQSAYYKDKAEQFLKEAGIQPNIKSVLSQRAYNLRKSD